MTNTENATTALRTLIADLKAKATRTDLSGAELERLGALRAELHALNNVVPAPGDTVKWTRLPADASPRTGRVEYIEDGGALIEDHATGSAVWIGLDRLEIVR